MKPIRTAAVVFALLAVLASAAPAYAQTRYHPRRTGRQYEVTLYVTSYDFDRDVPLDDEFGLGGRFGILFRPKHEVEFLLEGVATNHVSNVNADADVTNVQIAYAYNFTSSDVVPYLTAGYGVLHSDLGIFGEETDQAFSLGGGLRFFLGDVIFARVEWRRNFFRGDGGAYPFDQDLRLNELNFGVGWRFGPIDSGRP